MITKVFFYFFSRISTLELFHSKTIVELGSGSGLCGQMIQAIVGDCSTIMSDYCDDITDYIRENIEESICTFVKLFVDNAVFSELGISPPSAVTINFCQLDHDLMKSLKPNLVIATDVVFLLSL